MFRLRYDKKHFGVFFWFTVYEHLAIAFLSHLITCCVSAIRLHQIWFFKIRLGPDLGLQIRLELEPNVLELET